MKSINTKRIAAVAASLLMGLAFAGSGGVTWSNIPIINNQGQPVVQVVVGSTAMPSDGVVAANIAAVLGNLAFTSQNVTATATGLSNVNCVVTTPTCTLTNQQVWFGVHGFTGPSGSYSFTALIGSVLNAGVQFGAPLQTKTLQSSSSYAYPVTNPYATQVSPSSSPYSVTGGAPIINTPATATQAGGVSFSSFRSSGFDNILQVTSAQLPALANNWGSYGESEVLWLTGFPVFAQQNNQPVSGTPSLAVFDVGGVYQVKFNKPIPEPYVKSGNSINNAAIQLLGKNWTILNYTEPSTNVASSSNAITGGTLSLAASLTSLQTVYVGHNITSGPFSVQITDLGQPNSAGQSQAAVQVYYNGTLTNVTQLGPGTTTKFTVGTHNVYVQVNQTFAGLYAYQKWAKLKLYSNVVNITGNGQPLNSTNANGWNAYVLWTNGTASGGHANQLQGLVVVNQSPVTLLPGGSFSFVTPNMTAWKVNFVGDTLGTNTDPVVFSTTTASGLTLVNTPGSSVPGLASVKTISNQYAQVLNVRSSITNAFSFAGQTSSTLMYDLTPYNLYETQNTLPVLGSGSGLPTNIIISSLIGDGNIITPQAPVTVTLVGYQNTGSGFTQVTTPVTVYSLGGSTAASNVIPTGTNYYNITNVYMTSSLPDLQVQVTASNAAGQSANVLATYGLIGGVGSVATSSLLYYAAGNSSVYQVAPTATTPVTYNQQNGQSSLNGGFTIAGNGAPGVSVGVSKQYFTYTVGEYDVPGSTTSEDYLSFGIYNSTLGGAQGFRFQLNQSASGTKNNMTYTSSQGNSVQVPVNFKTERGSTVGSITSSSDTINMAKAVDTLQFVVSPSGASLSNLSTSSKVGPVSVGSAVPGFANLTVAAVNATCTGGSSATSACTVTGLANVTATPSVSSAVVPVSLNTATTPLVVLDSNANSAATLILVGSKYVNSVSAQVFAQNPSLNSSFGPSSVVVQAFGTNRILVAGYSANQTVQAGNQFINDLLQSASTP